MTLHDELTNSFPTEFEERIKLEIGNLIDLVHRKQVEVIERNVGLDEYVSLIKEKIKSFDSPIEITISYPFGSPIKLYYGENIVKYEKAYIDIAFL